MKKIFIKLYLLVLLTLAAGLFITFAIFLPLLSGIEKKDDLRIMQGVFKLAARELANTPRSEWNNRIKAMKTASGSLVSLLPLEEVESLDEKELSAIKNGKLQSIYEEDTFFKRLKNSDLVLRMKPGTHGSYWYTGEDERVTALTLHLIGLELKRYDQMSPEQAFEIIKPVFGFPIKLGTSVPQFDDPMATREFKRSGIWIDMDDETVWCNLPETPYYLKLGPLLEGQSYILRHAIYGIIGLFVLLIGFSAFLWTRPLWRDLDRLAGAAERFGKGDLTSRVNASPRSDISDLIRGFNTMAGQIESEISYRIELADAISHELRTPLARLRFAFAMIEESRDEQKRHTLSQEIELNIEELDKLIQELLFYSRMEHGLIDPKFREVNSANWLKECVEPFFKNNSGIEVRYHSVQSDTARTARFEPHLMARALSNLISNGIRYAKKTVLVSLELDGAHYHLNVEDDGCGIAEAQREKVFIPFTRLDDGRDRESGNHGLGLAIVRSIVARHGGEVRIEASSLGGAAFQISWPVFPGDQS